MNGWMDGEREREVTTHKKGRRRRKKRRREWMNKIIDLNGWGFVNAIWNEDDDVD